MKNRIILFVLLSTIVCSLRAQELSFNYIYNAEYDYINVIESSENISGFNFSYIPKNSTLFEFRFENLDFNDTFDNRHKAIFIHLGAGFRNKIYKGLHAEYGLSTGYAISKNFNKNELLSAALNRGNESDLNKFRYSMFGRLNYEYEFINRWKILIGFELIQILNSTRGSIHTVSYNTETGVVNNNDINYDVGVNRLYNIMFGIKYKL